MAELLFSVIIPLDFHRAQWERCLRGWQAQILPRSQFELILMIPPNFTDYGKLGALAGSEFRLEHSTESHDIKLCADGAASARGKFLFFTEAHCWPEPDVLQKCLQAFEAHPDWAAFSCKTLRVTHNRISEAEADMYESDMDFGLTVHPWRKVNDACFATYRDRFHECGGFDTELGHFAEWVLAANYFERGHKIGYVPEIIVHHYYVGDLRELSEFTRNFTVGEVKYFSRKSHDPSRRLFETPQWIRQDNRDRELARILLRIAARDVFSPSVAGISRRCYSIKTIMRWLSTAYFIEKVARIVGAVRVFWANATLRVASLVGSKKRVGTRFINFISVVVDHQRAESLRAEHRHRDQTTDTVEHNLTSGWNVFAPENVGFYQTEVFKEIKFRWSETAAILSAWMLEGQYRICVECLPVRILTHGTDLQFYLDGQPLPIHAVSIKPHFVEFDIWIARPGRATLAWTCRPFRTQNDRRELGLPIKRIRWGRNPAVA